MQVSDNFLYLLVEPSRNGLGKYGRSEFFGQGFRRQYIHRHAQQLQQFDGQITRIELRMLSVIPRTVLVPRLWQQFSDSPDLAKEIMNAIMDALAAHGTMSKQALNSERVRDGLKDVLLGPAQLYEALRGRGGANV
nr:hypothetical protein [Ferrovum sp.]